MDGDGQFKFGVCSTCVFPRSLMETSVNFRTIIQNLLGGIHDNSGLSIDVIHRSDDKYLQLVQKDCVHGISHELSSEHYALSRDSVWNNIRRQYPEFSCT